MSETIKPPAANKRQVRGFTLTEILVTIGIIVILIAIVVPTVSKVQKSARVAGVQAQLNGLQGAITRYQQDHGALPGPLSNDMLANPNLGSFPAPTPAVSPAVNVLPLNDGNGVKRITAAENLVLGLLGGLVLQAGGVVTYDPAQVGNGPTNLNAGQIKKFPTYIEATNLSWRPDPAQGGLRTGHYADAAGEATDSIIPEFVDTFSSPMPILYLRARKGAPRVLPINVTNENNSVITNFPNPTTGTRGHYDFSQFSGYVVADKGNYIGEGKSIDVNAYKPDNKRPKNPGQLPHGLTAPDLNASMDKAAQAPLVYTYPYNSYIYLKNPSSPSTDPQPRQKDGYILISAGTDRVYGTPDDITNFGSVNE